MKDTWKIVSSFQNRYLIIYDLCWTYGFFFWGLKPSAYEEGEWVFTGTPAQRPNIGQETDIVTFVVILKLLILMA